MPRDSSDRGESSPDGARRGSEDSWSDGANDASDTDETTRPSARPARRLESGDDAPTDEHEPPSSVAGHGEGSDWLSALAAGVESGDVPAESPDPSGGAPDVTTHYDRRSKKRSSPSVVPEAADQVSPSLRPGRAQHASGLTITDGLAPPPREPDRRGEEVTSVARPSSGTRRAEVDPELLARLREGGGEGADDDEEGTDEGPEPDTLKVKAAGAAKDTEQDDIDPGEIEALFDGILPGARHDDGGDREDTQDDLSAPSRDSEAARTPVPEEGEASAGDGGEAVTEDIRTGTPTADDAADQRPPAPTPAREAAARSEDRRVEAGADDETREMRHSSRSSRRPGGTAPRTGPPPLPKRRAAVAAPEEETREMGPAPKARDSDESRGEPARRTGSGPPPLPKRRAAAASSETRRSVQRSRGGPPPLPSRRAARDVDSSSGERAVVDDAMTTEYRSGEIRGYGAGEGAASGPRDGEGPPSQEAPLSRNDPTPPVVPLTRVKTSPGAAAGPPAPTEAGAFRLRTVLLIAGTTFVVGLGLGTAIVLARTGGEGAQIASTGDVGSDSRASTVGYPTGGGARPGPDVAAAQPSDDAAPGGGDPLPPEASAEPPETNAPEVSSDGGSSPSPSDPDATGRADIGSANVLAGEMPSELVLPLDFEPRGREPRVSDRAALDRLVSTITENPSMFFEAVGFSAEGEGRGPYESRLIAEERAQRAVALIAGKGVHPRRFLVQAAGEGDAPPAGASRRVVVLRLRRR